jgi:2-(1,2-epoxy-1,2-dihydrophenyl)acetyl-CoA isomerase
MINPPELNTLRIEIDDRIATLTLDRPDAFNAMSPEMIGELTVAMAWLADQGEFRALIVTGAGKAFCAGGDVNWFRKGIEDPDHDISADVRRGAEALHTAIVDLCRVEQPVIAAVNGPAAGAGFSLALACDFRISAESAFFAPAYGRIGASPDGGMTYFLPRVLGPSRALELLLDDPNLKAPDALEMGLVSEVVPDDQVMTRSRERAAALATLAPHYVKMAKHLVGTSLDHTITEHLQLERHGIADGLGTEDARLGVTAFFSGEKPEFTGT